jgi:hypothetical protein
MPDTTADGIGLAVSEVLAAVEAGRPPSPDDLRRRFPAWADELVDLLPGADPLRDRLDPLRDRTAAEVLPCGPGCAFAGFELVELLKVGGMGVVYRARDPVLGHDVCLKLIRGGAVSAGDDRDRLAGEARLLARLRHPHVVTVYQAGEADRRLYFCMEYLPTGDLDGRLGEFRKCPKAAARLVAQVARAVHHVHQHGVLHRDLKPANILLDGWGEPRVADFGLAVPVPGPGEPVSSSAGTPSYMSPEQAAGGAVTTLSDVWGLGAVLYALVTGRPPFEGKSVPEVLATVADPTCLPDDPRRVNGTADRALAAVCRRCLCKDPAGRYPSALAVAEELEHYLGGGLPDAAKSDPAAVLGFALGWFRPDAGVFRGIGVALVLYALLIFSTNAAAFALLRYGAAESLVWAAVFASYLPLFVILALKADPSVRSPAAVRLMWSLWAGHALAALAVLVPARVLLHPDFKAAFLVAYPAIAALTGLGFVVMGSVFWGGQYVLGVLWLLLAAAMPAFPEYGPLAYAVLMGGGTFVMGMQVLKRAVADDPLARDPAGWAG